MYEDEIWADFAHGRLIARPNGRTGEARIIALVDNQKAHRDVLNPSKAKHRKHFVDELMAAAPQCDAKEVDLCLQMIADELERWAAVQTPKFEESCPDPFLIAKRQLERTPQDVREAAQSMLQNENLLAIVLQDIQALGVVEERTVSLLTYLAGVSRLMEKPLYVLVVGPSASGKSFVTSKVLSLFPPESCLDVTDATANAAYYAQPGLLRHRVLYLGERKRVNANEDANDTRWLRELVERQTLTKWTVAKIHGELVARQLRVEGPTAVVETCSHEDIFAEDRNRAIVITTDDSQEQTRNILKRAAADYVFQPPQTTAIVAKHRAAQRLLQPKRVLIPFAPVLAEKFPATRIEARRAFNAVLRVIEALALLHQYQRPMQGDAILAVADDYAVARELLGDWVRAELGGGVNDSAARLWTLIAEKAGENTFTCAEVAKWAGLPLRTVRQHLTHLRQAGGIEIAAERQGRQAALYRIVGHEPPTGVDLPTVEEIAT